MREQLRIYFSEQEQQEQDAPITADPTYSVNLVSIRRDRGMEETDYLDCTHPLRTFRYRFDALRFAHDLARSPDAVTAHAEQQKFPSRPEFVVVLDADGGEVDRKPVLFVREFIGVYPAVFVPHGSESHPPFDVESCPVRVFAVDEAEDALDWAQNQAAKRLVDPKHNGVLVRDQDGQELARFKRVDVVRAKEPQRRSWLWRMLGWR